MVSIAALYIYCILIIVSRFSQLYILYCTVVVVTKEGLPATAIGVLIVFYLYLSNNNWKPNVIVHLAAK
jgi:hypothetical protein